VLLQVFEPCAERAEKTNQVVSQSFPRWREGERNADRRLRAVVNTFANPRETLVSSSSFR
jgi:hypothetical protein